MTFHRVIEDDYFIPPMAVNYKSFKRLIETFDRLGVLVDLEEAVEALRRNAFVGGKVALTFDDGYIDNFEIAAPLLRKMGVPATFFLPINQIDMQKPYWWDHLFNSYERNPEAFRKWLAGIYFKKNMNFERQFSENMHLCRKIVRDLNNKPDDARSEFLNKLTHEFGEYEGKRLIMNWDEARRLLIDGFGIGSHSITHTPLTDLSLEASKKEISESRKLLSERVGIPIKSFSYPRGAYNSKIKDLVRSAGYDLAVTTFFGSNGSKSDPFTLSRRTISDYTGIRASFPVIMYLLESTGILDKWLSHRR